jgi:hypothetical protein
MEGQGMGGQKLGENNLTSAGNDQDNPAQNAGEKDTYFKRTQPAEGHAEDFKLGEEATYQEGTADDHGYSKTSEKDS